MNAELVNDSLIGTSEEREHLLSEINDSYTQSLQKDKEKENENLYSQNKTTEELETSETAINLQLQRKRRVIPEPDIGNDVICLSVRHPELGTIRRLFKENVAMNYCYDWVGSLHKYPMHFRLIDPKGTSVNPSWKAKNFGQVVLNVQTIKEPLLLEDDGEISTPSFGTNVVNLELKKRYEQNDLMAKTTEKLFIFSVHRYDIVKSLFKIYNSDVSITQHFIQLVFKEENASGDGVTKDVYAHFYNKIFSLHRAGINTNVPTGLSEKEYKTLGKIITHAFILYNIFPIQLSKAFFEQVVTDSVRDSVLLDLFKDFVFYVVKILVRRIKVHYLRSLLTVVF